MRRLIVSSTQYPGYGGSATNAYSLIKYLRKEGHPCAGIFYENSNANVDPENIGGVFSINSNLKNYKDLKKRIIRYLNGHPRYIFSKNYVAPVLSRNLFARPKIVYLVSGCPHMMSLSKKGISILEYLETNDKIKFKAEESAIRVSNLIIPNSELSKKILNFHYGPLDKIIDPIDTSSLVQTINPVSFKKKRYDIACVCSNFNRSVKNTNLAQEILNHNAFKNKSIVIVGNNSKKYFTKKNQRVFGLVPHKKALSIISNSKVVINTSFYDASPNTLKEAISSGSNILTSRNCGWSETYREEFVVDNYRDINCWVNQLLLLTTAKMNQKVLNNNSILEIIE